MKARVQRVASYALIVDSDQRILLCRLSEETTAPGSYTLPGGGLEFGEHPEQAATREVLEETGLRVRVTELVKIDSELMEFQKTQFHAIRFIYRAEVVGGTLTHETDNSTDFCDWFTKQEAQQLPLVALASRGLSLAYRRA